MPGLSSQTGKHRGFYNWVKWLWMIMRSTSDNETTYLWRESKKLQIFHTKVGQCLIEKTTTKYMNKSVLSISLWFWYKKSKRVMIGSPRFQIMTSNWSLPKYIGHKQKIEYRRNTLKKSPEESVSELPFFIPSNICMTNWKSFIHFFESFTLKLKY